MIAVVSTDKNENKMSGHKKCTSKQSKIIRTVVVVATQRSLASKLKQYVRRLVWAI